MLPGQSSGGERSFARTVLGRSGFTVGRLGLSATYGMPASAVEMAFEQGMNYFYWGTLRRAEFARAIRNLAPKREQFVLVVQSYSPLAGLIGWSLEGALRSLSLPYADILLLGLWNRPIPGPILDACRGLRERGLVRRLAFSTHHRPMVAGYAAGGDFDVFHVRYNAVHTGAEQDVFPMLGDAERPGIVSYTATSWRQLLGHRRIPAGERVPTAGDCYRFVLSHPAVDVCMTGLASLEQTRHALDALRRGPMSADELAWMRRVGRAIYAAR